MSHTDLQTKCDELGDLYRNSIRSIVEKWTPERLGTYDDGFSHLERLSRSLNEPLRVGLLGAAGAGKSTLINALAFDGKHVLPVGGAGALTAQATRIRYSKEPYFCANYDARAVMTRLLAQLRGSILRTKQELEVQGADSEDNDPLQEMQKAEVKERQHFMQQTALLIKGNQNAEADSKLLIHVLDYIINENKELPQDGLDQNDEKRIAKLKSIATNTSLTIEPHYKRTSSEADWDFRCDLRNHAAGFLAPIVRDLEVGYPWEICDNNVELFDLPGLGVSGDSYVTVTENFIRKMDGVILVVNRSGILDTDVQFLDSSGLVQCLLYNDDRPNAEPMPLWVVSTRSDDTVISNLEGKAQGLIETTLESELTDYQSTTLKGLRKKLQDTLNDLVETWSDEAKKNANTAISQAINSAKFHVVSSAQYNKIKGKDSKFPAHFEHENQTGIPELNIGLSEISLNFAKHKYAGLAKKHQQLEQELHNWGEYLRQMYSSAIPTEDRIAIMRVRIRNDLEPKTKEVQSRLAGFRVVLDKALLLKLENVISDALRPAEASARRKVDSLTSYHWASLRATVVKGGIHSGTVTINLPKAFSDPLEGELIPRWQHDILDFFNGEIHQLADDLKVIIKEMSELAGSKESLEEGNALTAFADQMSGDILQLRSILDETSQEIRDSLKVNLYRAIREPILQACRQFVEQGRQLGPGTKNRILALFEHLASEVLCGAAEEVKGLLAGSLEVIADRTRNCLRPYYELQGKIESLLLPPMDPESVARREIRCKEAIRDAEDLSGLLRGARLLEITSVSRNH